MAEGDHADMHRDHQYWLTDCAMWRDDIGLWKEEWQKAIADLERMEAALRWIAESIANHEAGVDRHMGKIHRHEHAVSEFEQSGRGDTVEMLTFAKVHREEAAGHLNQRDAHERLKRDHHIAMAHWHTLLAELTKAMK